MKIEFWALEKGFSFQFKKIFLTKFKIYKKVDEEVEKKYFVGDFDELNGKSPSHARGSSSHKLLYCVFVVLAVFWVLLAVF